MKSQKLPCHVILIKSSLFLMFWWTLLFYQRHGSCALNHSQKGWGTCRTQSTPTLQPSIDTGITTVPGVKKKNTSVHSHAQNGLADFLWGISMALQQGQASLVLLLFPQCSMWGFSTVASLASSFLTGFWPDRTASTRMKAGAKTR